MKTSFLALLFLICSLSLNAQIENQSTFWDNVRFGGGIGLNFGNGFFSGSLAPAAIYDFSPYFSAGVGLNGSYTKFDNDFSSTVFGGNIIALVNPVNEIQLSAEFEQLNVTQRFDTINGPDIKDNFWASALFLGVGFRTGNVAAGIRYDVLYDEDRSIYADPWMPFVRVWF
jgi:hypothetical protein